MKTVFRLFLIVAIALMLSGCGANMMTTTTTLSDGTVTTISQPGSIFGPSSYDIGYAGMYQAHAQSKAARATAIQNSACPEDAAAAAYCNAAKMMGVSMLALDKFDVQAPRTGFDVLYKATDSIVPVAAFGTLWQLGKGGIENAGSQFGDEANLSNSLNRTQSTANNAGAGTASSTTSGTMPAAEPVIVEPVLVPVE